jgi:hypothetical protein
VIQRCAALCTSRDRQGRRLEDAARDGAGDAFSSEHAGLGQVTKFGRPARPRGPGGDDRRVGIGRPVALEAQGRRRFMSKNSEARPRPAPKQAV